MDLIWQPPPFVKELYDAFRPYYERVIRNKIEFGDYHENGIVRHLVAFYFWEFCGLENNGLLMLFFDSAQLKPIRDFIVYVNRQEEYVCNLNAEEKYRVIKRILELWSFLVKKYGQSVEEVEILVELSRFLMFVEELDMEICSLVCKSTAISTDTYHYWRVFENLMRLKSNGILSNTAKYIGLILNSIPYWDYIQQSVILQIKELTEFVYINDRKNLADKFCNKMAKSKHEFLIPIYDKYNT